MNLPSISVIIPSYNCGRWVTDSIDSALRQTLRPTQIVVVDDGSTDDTRRRVEAFAQRGVEYIFQENQGVSAARNAGLRLTRGECIAFLDADDVWHPRKLELQCASLTSRPDLQMLGTRVFTWPGMIPVDLRDSGNTPIIEVSWNRLVVKNYFTTSSLLLRRSTLATLGPDPFDTSLQGPEDYDLWLRIAEQGKVANLELALTGYRSHLTGLGNQPAAMHAGMGRILKKLGERGAWKRKSRFFLRWKAHSYFHYSCALMFGAAGKAGGALRHVILSMLHYPIPFGQRELKTTLARPRLFGACVLRMLGLI